MGNREAVRIWKAELRLIGLLEVTKLEAETLSVSSPTVTQAATHHVTEHSGGDYP